MTSEVRVQELLERSQDRLANGCDEERYNIALRDASAWWLAATRRERAQKQQTVTTRHKRLQSLFLKPPHFDWYNRYLQKKLEKYDAWHEVIMAATNNTGNSIRP